MEAILVILLFLLLALGFLSFLVLQRHGRALSDAQAGAMAMQSDALRTELRDSLRTLNDTLSEQLRFVTTQLQTQTQSVGSRLDTATRVIGDVQKNLGELGRATEEIRELGQSVSKLDNLLRAPKLRGGLGEFLLEDLLREVLPADHYVTQYRFRNGTIVDAVIRTSDSLVPIDSKFPLENFRRMSETTVDAERRTFRRAFFNDVRKHVDAVADKYIRPEEGTFPFAMMYIPSESIYYEVILSAGAQEPDSVADYAMRRNVVAVSPNSFYAYLLVIMMGLRGLKIEERAREIQHTLGGLQADADQLRSAFDTLGTHIDNAQKKYGDVDKQVARLEGKIASIALTAGHTEDNELPQPRQEHVLHP